MDFYKRLEDLASLQHGIWSHWMEYLFRVGTLNEDGTFTIPADKVERWMLQMETKYHDLPEDQRESDRDQAKKVINLLSR